MNRIFVFVFIIFSLAFASLQDPVEVKIKTVNKTAQTITFDAKDLIVGEVGWIYITTTDYATIIYQAQIIKIQDSIATAVIQPYSALKQIYLPNPTNQPKVGDSVIFRKLNSRAFLITPTLELYEQIKDKHKEVTLMSSDLLLGYLYAYGNYDPTPSFLKNACDVYAVGLLYVVATKELAILDCQSLKILKSYSLDTSGIKDVVSPFYSRIKPVTTGTLFSTLASKKSKYYFSYYTSLIHPNLSYQKLLLTEKPIVDAAENSKKMAEKKEKERLKEEEKKEKEHLKEEKKKEKERLKEEKKKQKESKQVSKDSATP